MKTRVRKVSDSVAIGKRVHALVNNPVNISVSELVDDSVRVLVFPSVHTSVWYSVRDLVRVPVTRQPKNHDVLRGMLWK